jgi:cytochrome c-type biogenesis protein CcmF
MVVHIGVVLIAVAMAASGSYDTERELTMEVGDTATVAGHDLEYLGARTVTEPNKISTRARVSVDGEVHEPAINLFGDMPVGTPSVATSLRQDVYLTLLQAPADDAGQTATIRVIVQPLITWLWIGGIVMVLGTALAAFPGRRRRNPIDPVSAPVPGADLADGGGSGGRPTADAGAGAGDGDDATAGATGAGAGVRTGAGDGDRDDEAPERVEVGT